MIRLWLARVSIGLGTAGLLFCAFTLVQHVRGLNRARALERQRFEQHAAAAGELVRVGDFEIDKTEVSVKSYRACVLEGGCSPPSQGEHCNFHRQGREDHPVNCVDHRQASAYCAWAGRRLPLAWEWDSAGCAGREGKQNACYDRDTKWESRGAASFKTAEAQGTCPVNGDLDAISPRGVLGATGNVAEWTGSEEYVGGVLAHRFFVKGQSWATPSWGSSLECSSQEVRAPEYRDALIGFRCARSEPKSLTDELLAP